MINIAAFIDFKSGKLSPRSIQIVNLIHSLTNFYRLSFVICHFQTIFAIQIQFK